MTIALPGDTLAPWRRHGVALAGATLALLAIFHRDAVRMVDTWWISTTFGHCLLIGPIVGWLVWQRRGELARLIPVAWGPGLMVVAAGGMAWLLGEAGQVVFARQLGLIVMIQGAVVTLLGPSIARGLAFPLSYALFLVPFGEWLEAPLQSITVALTMPLLALTGIPAVSDGVMIHAGRYYFEVAEACSGAKFVIAMLAFGVLVAHVGFVSWRRRIAFMILALVVPVLGNGFRAFATIWVADRIDVETATGFDHIVYGFVFFALLMAGVLAIGWRWFDRAPDAPVFDPAQLTMGVRAMPIGVATMLVMGVAGAFPAWSLAVAARAVPAPAQIALPVVAGWQRVPIDLLTPWQPWHPGADHVLFGRYAAAGDAVDVGIALYAIQGEGRELVSYGTGVLRQDDIWLRVADLPRIAGGSAMRIRRPGLNGQSVDRIVVTWYRIGDITTSDERRVKIETARAALLGGSQRAIAVHLSIKASPGSDPVATITRFVAATGGIEALADRL